MNKSADGGTISSAAVFLMGLPNEFAQYVFFVMLILIPVTFFAPAIAAYIKRFKRPPPEKTRPSMTLWQRCLCVLLAYTMLITPAGLQEVAQAATQYSQIATTDWASDNRTIEYTYDDNGSCITKTTKVTTPEEILETIEYEYNLQNRHERYKSAICR